MVAHYNNTVDNPYNPHKPPKAVHWGPKTSDEMCLAFIDIAPQRKAEKPEELRLPTRDERIKFLLMSQGKPGDPEPKPTDLRWILLLDRLRAMEEGATGKKK